MPNTTDPTPDPRRTPPPGPDDGNRPDSSTEVELNLAGPLDQGSGVAFDLPDLPAGPGDSERTIGAAFADLPGLSGLLSPDPAKGRVKDLPPLHVEEVSPIAEFAPVSEVLPVTEPEALDADLPLAESASSSHLFGELPPAGPDSDHTDHMPAESSMVGLGELTPLPPGAGWLDTDPGDQAAPREARIRAGGSATQIDPIEAGLAGPAPNPDAEGSDIFAGGPIPTATSADASDVIAATALGQTAPATPIDPVVPIPSAARPSDVALTFDQPPGGSTIHDPTFESGLPVADPASGDDLFGRNVRTVESIALPEDHGGDPQEYFDLGAPERLGASNILADVVGDDPRHPGDSAAIRLDAPGVRGTLTDNLDSQRFSGPGPDATDPEFLALRSGAHAAPAGPPAEGGSDLFTDVQSRQHKPVDPDDAIGGAEPLPPGTAQSSIFSEPRPPAPARKKPGDSVRTAQMIDVGDSVEFSDHPDPDLADSASLHAATSVEFELPDEHDNPEKTDRAPFGNVPSAAWESVSQAVPAAPRGKGKVTAKTPAVKGDPSMVVDWVASDSKERPVPPAAKAARTRRPEPEPTDDAEPVRAAGRSGGGGRTVAGLVAGLVLGVGGAAGAYFAGLLPEKGDGKPTVSVPNPNPGTTQPPVTTPPTPPAGGVADAHVALQAGDPARALAAIEAAGADTTEAKATRGQARLFARVRELAQTNAAAAADDAQLKQARADLEAVVNDPDAGRAGVRAALHLGLTYELAGDRAKAREVYADGAKKFPQSAAVFEAALDRLDATNADAGKTSHRLTPADVEQLAVGVGILFTLAEPAAAEEPAEAGPAFWKAVNAAAAGQYAEAVKRITEAKQAHERRARALAGRGLNPLSDPLEQIFPRCCDELKAYWELRRSLYEHPAVGALVKKEGVAKALAQLADAEKRVLDVMKTAAELKQTNDTLAADLKKATDKVAAAEKELLVAKDTAAKLDKDLKGQTDSVVKLEKDLQSEKDSAAKLSKDLKAQQQAVVDLTAKLKTADAALQTAGADRKAADDLLAAIAKELQGGKLLPEKYDAAAVAAAVRSAVSRGSGTGPDLSQLIPPELSAVAGTGLTTGHILDLAARVKKAEVAARLAAAEVEKVTAQAKTDLAKLTADHDAAVKKLKDGYAAESKKLTDAHAAELKKLNDAHAAELKKAGGGDAVATDKLKAAHAAELKVLTDKFAAETKKLADAHAAELKLANDAAAKLKVAAAADLKVLADKYAAELKKADAAAAQIKAAADAELKALADKAAADAKVLADRNAAEAKRAADEHAAVVKALEAEVAALRQPGSPPRLPVAASRKDAATAARFLDAGVTAYRAGRYADAERALARAVFNDPDGAVAWYFLGAARWAEGKADPARDDFRQGAVREQARLVPARVIDAAIRPIQGPARDALDAARP